MAKTKNWDSESENPYVHPTQATVPSFKDADGSGAIGVPLPENSLLNVNHHQTSSESTTLRLPRLNVELPGLKENLTRDSSPWQLSLPMTLLPSFFEFPRARRVSDRNCESKSGVEATESDPQSMCLTSHQNSLTTRPHPWVIFSSMVFAALTVLIGICTFSLGFLRKEARNRMRNK
jgi:hypothetical protein